METMVHKHRGIRANGSGLGHLEPGLDGCASLGLDHGRASARSLPVGAGGVPPHQETAGLGSLMSNATADTFTHVNDGVHPHISADWFLVCHYHPSR